MASSRPVVGPAAVQRFRHLCSVVVVADIGSDAERVSVRAEAMADRTEELQFIYCTILCRIVRCTP